MGRRRLTRRGTGRGHRIRLPPRERGVPFRAYPGMTDNASITIRATAHPIAHIHRAGFPLDHPYIERCWTPVLGPSSVLLLRRMPDVFRQSPATLVPLDELAGGLGIGGTGQQSAIRRTLDRVVRFRFGAWTDPDELDIYTTAPPLNARQLERSDPSTRQAHERLLTEHLDALAPGPGHLDALVTAPTGTTDLVARLNRLQHPSVVPLDAALGR